MINVEEEYPRYLSAPEQRVKVNPNEFYPEDIWRFDVDGFIEALKQSKVID